MAVVRSCPSPLAMGTILSPATNRIRRLLLPSLLPRAKQLKGTTVYQLNATTVVKVTDVNMHRAEVDATKYVAANTTIPVPRIYDHWEHGSDGYIVMEFIEGVTLRKAWKTLTSAQRARIMHTLVGYIHQLRALPQPPPPPSSNLPRTGWIGSASCRGFSDMLAYSNYTPIGPLPNQAAWHDWRLSLYRFALSNPSSAARLAQIRKEFREDDPIVFTHGDLSMLNIMVRVDGDRPEDARITAVIDWEQAGWRPIYWEGVKCLWMESKPDWVQFIREALNAGYAWVEQLEVELVELEGGIPPG